MLEELRIKCPSCDIILDVRNSRHEAIKRIVCPNCQKQLALDFREQPQKDELQKPLGALYHGEQRLELHEGINQIPLAGCQFVHISVVRLSDGNSKCIVSPLKADHPVIVNGQALQPDDKVVLGIGDEVNTDGTLLVYGKPGKAEAPIVETKKDKKEETTKKPSGINPNWFYGLIACVAVALAVVALWPSPKEESMEEEPITTTPVIKEGEENNGKEKKGFGKKKGTDKEKEIKQKGYSEMSDYDLEQRALKGDAEAQFQLGNKLVRRRGSNSIIRGLNYLQKASQNGSAKANSVLENAIYSLQRKASDGDSIAYQILMSIN